MFFQLCYIYFILESLLWRQKCWQQPFVVGCYQIHDTRTVNREQNVIEKHTTAWQRDGESEAAPTNKRKATQGKNGFVKKKKKERERVKETVDMSERKGAWHMERLRRTGHKTFRQFVWL